MIYDISINNHKYITNWVFSKRSLDTSFYWSNKANHKLFKLIIFILIPLKIDLIALHAPNF